MELQRYEMGDYCSGYVPNDDGEVCMSYEVRWLEESHKELLEALKLLLAECDHQVSIGNMPYDWVSFGIARATITKAEGMK